MVGELPDPRARRRAGARATATRSPSVGPFAPSLAGSELAKLRGELGPGPAALPIDDGRARRSTPSARRSARGACAAAHDVSDGGLACALAEWRSPAASALEVDLDELVEPRGCSGETALFGEGPGGFVLAGEREPQLEALAEARASTCSSIGRGRRRADRDLGRARPSSSVALADAERAWRSLGERLERAAAAA